MGASDLDKALLETKEEAESSYKAKIQVLSDLSHEIRTLMTRIMGMTDLTLMTELTEEQLDYLTIVKSSSGQLLKVFNDMQNYSKIQAGNVTLEQSPFDIRETIHEVVQLFQVAAKQKKIYIEFNSMDQEIPKNIFGDSFRLKKVLIELVGNSVRFTNNGRVTIKVDLEELNESSIRLKFIVSDSGIGIPEEKLVKLFKSNLDDSNPRNFGSTGLTNSKKLVELMDGAIYVNSTVGVGSEFFFSAEFGVREADLKLPIEDTLSTIS